MEVIEQISALFFSTVSTVVSGAPYLLYLLIGAFGCAILFNLAHMLLGGD